MTFKNNKNFKKTNLKLSINLNNFKNLRISKISKDYKNFKKKNLFQKRYFKNFLEKLKKFQ